MENTIGQEFIEKTKYKNLEKSPQSQGAPWPPLSLPLPDDAEVTSLPKGKALKLEKLDFTKLVESRETRRKYSDQCLNLKELGYLLWGTQGVKSVCRIDRSPNARCLRLARGMPLKPTC